MLEAVGLVIAAAFGWFLWKIALPLYFVMLVGTIGGHSEPKAKAFLLFYATNRVVIHLAVTLAVMAATYWGVLHLGALWGALAVIVFMFLVWVVTVLA